MKEKTTLQILVRACLGKTFLLLLPVTVFASGGEHHGGIPWDTIAYQAINVSIVFGALLYFAKQPIKEFFSGKREAFVQASEKATSVKKKAEQDHLEIKVQLTKLESTADESVARARAEAADLRLALISEAEALSEKMKKDAENAAKLEVERAKISLRRQLIEDSLAQARKQMVAEVSAEDQKRLQENFINNIQAVQ